MDLRKFAVVVALCSVCATTAFARGGWQDPPGGWDYMLEAGATDGTYVALPAGTAIIGGLLDGTWSGGVQTYFWDGSAPGVYDITNADGNAPGGAELATRVGLGDGGGNATVLALEVAGDTTVATGNPFNFAWTTPANEAVYFVHPIYQPGQTTTLANPDFGVTVIARWRLTPGPKDAVPPGGQNWVSSGFTTSTDVNVRGKGMISLVDQDDFNASIGFRPDGTLSLMDQYNLNYAGSPTSFVTAWMTVMYVNPNTWRVEVYLNGSTTAAFAQDVTDYPEADESGNDPAYYLAFGLPVKGVPGAMELDYIGYKVGFLRPGQTQMPPAALACAIDTSVTPSALNLTWTIPAGAVYDSIQILADGALIDTIAGTETAWTTTTLLPGQHTYGVRAVVGATQLQPQVCFVSDCPGQNVQVVIDYTRQPPAAHVTWDPVAYAATRIEVAREGVVLADNLPPDAVEYWDSTLTAGDGEVAYDITFVPTTGRACGAQTTRHVILLADEIAFLDPDGGWDYVYDPDTHDPIGNPMDKYVTDKGVEGCLDGTWIRSFANDFWDGAAPGNSTPPDDPSPIAPGGIEIRDRPGEGLGGVATKTLSIEDPGDPTGGGYADPSNRKIVLGRVLTPPDNLLGGRYAEGVTMYVRFRLTPDPRDVVDPPNGDPVRDSNHGMITLCYNDGDPAANVDATGSRSFGMSLNGDALDLSDGGDIQGLEPGQWVSVWFMTQDTDRNGAYHSSMYLNGSLIPVRPDWRRATDDANVTIDRWEEQLFADTAQAFTAIVIGGMYSGNDCAFEIDFIKIKHGAVAPTSGNVTRDVTNLVCTGSGNDVAFTWADSDAYDSIEVREGATTLLTLAGDAVQAALAAQPNGAHTYSVVAVKGGLESTGVDCSVTLPAAAPTPAVRNLACRGAGNDVTLTWTNGGSYDSIEVRESASVLATLAGTAVQTVLAGQPDGAHTYTVIAVKSGTPSSGATCSVTLPASQGDTIYVYMGNVNGDAKADIADAIALLGYLFAQKVAPKCAKAADANDDNAVNIGDAIAILGYLFGGKTMTAPDGSLIDAKVSPAKCTGYPATGTGPDGKPNFPPKMGDLPTCETQCQ